MSARACAGTSSGHRGRPEPGSDTRHGTRVPQRMWKAGGRRRGETMPWGLLEIAAGGTRPLQPSVQAGSFRHCEKRSEEHTSELQSLMRTSYAVFCLKKKTNNTNTKIA